MNAIILAGGKNSRIGTRKALLKVNGKPIIQRTIEVLQPLFDKIILVTNEPDIYRSFGLPMVSDEIPGEGPLSGIHAGLGISDPLYNLVVACDMPFVEIKLLEYLKSFVNQVGNSDQSPACIIPSWSKGIEPLHALYHRRVRQEIPPALQAGVRSLRKLVQQWNCQFVELDGWASQHRIDLERVFSNVNTWVEFEQATELARNLTVESKPVPPKVLSVVGYADNGKTTFLEGLLPELQVRGVSVAVFKHHGHRTEPNHLDNVGTDTWRLAQKGANPVGLVQGRTVSLYFALPVEPTPEELAQLVPGVDLVITEGFKRARNPKIEVWRHADQKQPACNGDPYLIGLVTSHQADLPVPSFALNDYAGVAEFIINYFQLV